MTILPADRHIVQPLEVFMDFKQTLRSWAFAGWVLLWLSITGLMVYSFVQNSIAPRPDFKKFENVFYSKDLDKLLRAADTYYTDLNRLTRHNQGWGFFRMGLWQSCDLEEALKEKYVRGFDQYILHSQEENLKKSPPYLVSSQGQNRLMDTKIFYLTRLMLQANISDTARVNLFRDVSQRILPSTGVNTVTAGRFAYLYQAYVLWGGRYAGDLEVRDVEMWLKDRNEILTWMMDFFGARTAPYRLSDFWGPTAAADSSIIIPSALTPRGWDMIWSCLSQIQRSFPESRLIKAKVDTIKTVYVKKYWKSWETFAANFNQGYVHTPEAMLGYNNAMTNGKNAYFKLADSLAVAASRIIGVYGIRRTPESLKQIVKLREIRTLAEREGSEEAAKSEKPKKSNRLASKIAEDAQLKECAKGWKEYLNTLKEFEPMGKSPEECYKFISSEIIGQSHFNGSFEKLGEIKNRAGADDQSNYLAWKLAAAPLRFLAESGIRNSGAHLQNKWDKKVNSMPPEAGYPNALDIKADAEPFLSVTPSGGIKSRALQGYSIRFTNDFLKFYCSRQFPGSAPETAASANLSAQQEFTVKLGIRPMEVNPEARVQPTTCILELHSAEGSIQRLVMESYEKYQTFQWNPEKGGDAVLTIIVPQVRDLPQIKLKKSYSGDMGFRKFLRDFEGGSKRLERYDFDENGEQMPSRNLSWIKVGLYLDDSDDHIKVKNYQPPISGGGMKSGAGVPSLPLNIVLN